MKLKHQPVVHTDRLCLRAICDTHKDAMLALFTNEEVCRTYMIPEFQSFEEQLRLFERFKELSAREDRFVYGICLEDQLIGFLNDVAVTEREAELGYVIAPSHKNNGYATEVLKTAIRLFFEMGFAAVIAGVFAENPASMRVMEKPGMVRTGEEEIIAYRGKDHRCFYYKKENDLK